MTNRAPGDFWEFSLAFYARPGVAEACVGLQDEYALDVNVLLLALYAGRRHIALGAADFASLERTVRAWRRQAVVPLRRVRRGIRPMLQAMPGIAREAYDAVKQAELADERVQQACMEQWLTARGGPADACAGPAGTEGVDGRSGQAADLCCVSNLDAYLRSRRRARDAGLDARLQVLREALRALLQAG